MKIFYSPTSDSFYPDELKDIYLGSNTWPSDGVEVSQEVFVEFSLSGTPDSKKRSFKDGQFIWVDAELTEEQLATIEISWVTSELQFAGAELDKLQDSDDPASGTVNGWRAYRKELRQWASDAKYPNKEFRPIRPVF